MTGVGRQARRGLTWIGPATAIAGGLDALATILLLRFWLSPAEYGVAAVAVTLFPMLDLVADAGFTAAIVQRAQIDRAVLSSAAWAATVTSFAGVALAVGLGAALAALHDHPVLVGLFALYGARMLLGNLGLVPIARLRRDLRFSALASVKLCASAAEFAAKLAAAASGLGVWCFVLGHMAKALVQVTLAQVLAPFVPAWHLRRAEVAELFAMGGRSSASHVLFHLYSNADYQIVGAFFGSAAAGLYRAAYELVLEPAKLLTYIVVEVAFPVFARLRDDTAALAAQFLWFTRQNLWVVVTVMAVIASVPADLLELFFGSRWRPAANAVELLCAVGGLRAMSFLMPPLLDGIGRSDLTLRYTLVAAVAVPATQVAAAAVVGDAVGWRAVAWGWVVAYPLAFVVLVALALSMLGMSARVYLRSVAPILGAGALALAVGRGAAAWLPVTAAATRVAIVAAVVTTVIGLSRAARRRW